MALTLELLGNTSKIEKVCVIELVPLEDNLIHNYYRSLQQSRLVNIFAMLAYSTKFEHSQSSINFIYPFLCEQLTMSVSMLN